MTQTPDPSCIAVAPSGYCRPNETFVNYHVEHLFGGRTVVVASSRGKPAPIERPEIYINELSAGPFDRARSWLAHRRLDVPFGKGRAELAAFLEDHGARAILAEFAPRAATLAPVAQELGIPIFTYYRGYDASSALRQRDMVGAYRRMMPRLAGVFAVSQFLLDQLASKDIRHDNAHVVPSGADTTFFLPRDKVPARCVMVGRLVEKKSPMVSLQAFLEAASTHPDATLTVIGHGSLQGACEALVNNHENGGRVTFLGFQQAPAIRDALSTAQVFLQHSVTQHDGNTEGLPSTIQEAMACGCAVLSTRHAGIPEAVQEGITGRLVDENDAQGFSAALGEMLADPQGTAAMGRSARDHAIAHLDKKLLTDRIETVIRQSL